MSRDHWFRNETWDDQIEADFRTRLARARGQKPQYLKIQAYCLAHRFPQVALGLIDEYFATDDTFFVADALAIRARALEALGDPALAIAALKEAMDWESKNRGLNTNAKLKYPHLVAVYRVECEYENALSILTGHFEPQDFIFPYSRYVWNGALALILHEQGKLSEARHFAEQAMEAAEAQSPFRYHRSVGVVEQTSDEFGERIKRIAQLSTE